MKRHHLMAAAVLLGGMLPVLGGVGAGPASADTTPTCFGRTVTVMGTAGNDYIEPTHGVVDVIWTGAGDDTIAGEVEGRYATDGGDFYGTGWRGADVMYGNGGNDTIEDDSIDSNDTANDVFHGGPGDDTLVGGWGAEKFYGEDGHDVIVDSECAQKSYLYGGSGSDRLESYQDSYEGTFCGELATDVGDVLNGGGGTTTLDNYDYAQVSENDAVSQMERTIRYSVG
jgi:Ca2+-binding RTX toxin-like protein